MSRLKKRAKAPPSRKLKAVFYRLWEKDNEGYKEFDSYYLVKITKLVNHYKKML